MNPHIQRILEAERSERAVPVSGLPRTSSERGMYDSFTRWWCSWFDEVTKPSILPVTVPQGFVEHNFSTDELRMPLKVIPVLRASLVNTDILDCTPDMLERIVRAHPGYKQWKLLDENSTYVDLLTIALNNWLKNKADYWHIEDEVAYGVNENWEASTIHVGWAYNTPMWPLVCLLLKQAIKACLFAMELDQAADMSEENVLDVTAGEEPSKEQLDARNEDWMQPWFPAAIKQLYHNKFRLGEQLKKLDLPSDMAIAIKQLLNAVRKQARIEKQFNDYDVCLKIDDDGEWQHEQGFNQVYWGRNDSWLSGYLDEMMESQLQSGATIICSTVIMRIDDSFKESIADTTVHYKRRVELRHAFIQCLEQLQALAKTRKMI